MPRRSKKPTPPRRPDHEPSGCSRCGKPIVGFECTEENRHRNCLEKPIVALAHLHWWCSACGFGWVAILERSSTTLCVFCKSDLARILSRVPEPVASKPFPFRCPECSALLLVRPVSGGLTLQRFPLGEIEKPDFQKPETQGLDQAN